MYISYSFQHGGWISLLLPRLTKLPGPLEEYWLGNLGIMGSNEQIQPDIVSRTPYDYRYCNRMTSDHAKGETRPFV